MEGVDFKFLARSGLKNGGGERFEMPSFFELSFMAVR